MSDDFAELNQIYAPAQAQAPAPAQAPGASSGVPGNNFGGVRSGKNSFASYPTPEAGIGAMLSTLQHHIAKAPQGQLNLYGLVGGLTPQGTLPSDADDPKTLQGGWAPATDHNNPVAYAKGLGGALGLDPYKDTIDPTDSGQMAKLVYAIAKQEHGAKNIPPPEIFQKAVGAALPTPGALDPGTFDDLKSIYTPPSTPAPVPALVPGPTAPPKASASPAPAIQTYTAKSETAADPTGGANQYNGALREPAIAGSGLVEGAGNALDLPHNLLSWAGRKVGVPQTLMDILGLGNSPLSNPTASEALHATGVTENPALTPQGPGERVLHEWTQGVGASLPLLPVTGPEAALGMLMGGGLGNVAGQEGGPTVTKGLTAVGVPQGVADVAGPIVASVPGAVVGGGMGNMASRAAGALAGGEGPLAAAGAAAPGTTLSTSINPGIQDLAQSASTAGIRIPSQFLAEDASTLPPVPLAALKQTWGDITQKLANSIGLNKRTLFEGDLDTAKAKAGDVMDTALANSTTPLGTVAPDAYLSLVSNLHDIGTSLNLTKNPATAANPGFWQSGAKGEVSEASSKLAPVLNDIEAMLRKPTDLTGDAYQQLTNKGSKLALAQAPGASADTKYFASQIRNELNDAVSPVMGLDVKATFDQARMNYKNVMLLDPAVRASDTGIPNLALARNAVNKQYNGFVGADAASPGLGTAMRVADVVPHPTVTAGVLPLPSLTVKSNHLGSIAGVGLLGATAPHAVDLLHSAMQSPNLAAALGAGVMGGGGLVYGGNKLAQGLNTARGAYLASPTGTGHLLDILAGRTPAPQGWLEALTRAAGVGGLATTANQPPQQP